MSLMAEAEFTSGQNESADPSESLQPKLYEQYRLQRLGWFGLVGVLVVTGIAPEWLALHHGVGPLAAGLVLLAAAILEFRRAGSKTISAWVAGIFLLLIAGFNFVSRPDLDFSLLVAIVVIIVIALGIFKRDRE